MRNRVHVQGSTLPAGGGPVDPGRGGIRSPDGSTDEAGGGDIDGWGVASYPPTEILRSLEAARSSPGCVVRGGWGGGW